MYDTDDKTVHQISDLFTLRELNPIIQRQTPANLKANHIIINERPIATGVHC